MSNTLIKSSTTDSILPFGGVRGYPALAAAIDAEDGVMMYRRFGDLQSRLLLEKR